MWGRQRQNTNAGSKLARQSKSKACLSRARNTVEQVASTVWDSSRSVPCFGLWTQKVSTISKYLSDFRVDHRCKRPCFTIPKSESAQKRLLHFREGKPVWLVSACAVPSRLWSDQCLNNNSNIDWPQSQPATSTYGSATCH